MLRAVLPLLCLVVISHVTEAKLTIGAFNIQRLSDGKTEDAALVEKIAQILIRYDVATVEEVLHMTAMQRVLQEMNRLGGPYSMSVGSATGRSRYTEYLVIVYRSDKLSLLASLQYPDHDDVFEREPYSVLFHTTDSRVTKFGFMGVHLRPDDVRVEIDALIKAYEDASAAFHTQNFLIAGDFNADCRYLSNRAYHNSAIFQDDRFEFLVDITADSTVNSNTDCAYDRFVATGSVRPAVVSGSVRVYDYQTSMDLSYDQALEISDHFPIEMQLQ